MTYLGLLVSATSVICHDALILLQVMHMKRFQCSARWREKIRTLVVFPHSGLDMSAFVSANSAHRNQARFIPSRPHGDFVDIAGNPLRG